MIEKVTLKYFKSFEKESFDLKDAVVLAGQNNAGKTTLLQAIATWHFAFREWQKKRGASSAKQRTSVPLTRKEFLSVPVQAFKLLWTDTVTALKKSEGGGKGAATPRIMEIALQGKNKDGTDWIHTMEFRHSNSEQIYAKPSDPEKSPEVNVVYIPSFSGIETEEKVHTREYQEWLIGQGKPGDIIRNLLVEVSLKEEAWEDMSSDVEDIFGYRILKPQHVGRPFILCEYLPGIPRGRGYGGYPRLEISNAGSGFLQTLLLLAFFYARPASVLLIDEPDAHMHMILQKRIYNHLRTIASGRGCQIIVATHSEVVIDNTDAGKIVSFYGKPHLLKHDTQRDEVREALKRLESKDIILAEQGKILYVEGESDFSILRAWAKVLKHPLMGWLLTNPYCHPIRGSNPKEAREHFFALRATKSPMTGVLLLDGDNKDVQARDLKTDGLKLLRWKRYEIENYLIHPVVLEYFAQQKVGRLLSKSVVKELKQILPPEVIDEPTANHDYMRRTPASKDILPRIFDVGHLDVSKMEYYQIAEIMRPEEIHKDVRAMLDAIADHFGI
ncbi:MAG: AAA family ATPase [Gammaproteobacteria bacterium]|nr:AAA family ATPase [Gammaproteobacteria bacterium]